MSTLTLRTAKGFPLTNAEVDANFTNLLVALGGTNAAPYTLPTPPAGGGTIVLSNSPTFSGTVSMGDGATATRFPNAGAIVSDVTTNQQTLSSNIGLFGETKATTTTSTATGTSGANTITISAANSSIVVGQGVVGSGIAPNATVTGINGTTITLSANNTGAVTGTATFADYAYGLYGSGYTSGVALSSGMAGVGRVSSSLDTGNAIGVTGTALDAHAGGMNIGIYGDATGGSTNYALYLNRGNIYSSTAITWNLNGNLTFSGASVTIPTLTLTNALATAQGGTGSTSTAYCSLTSNVSGTLPIASGGTGATSAAAALTALGAYASSNPSGYTSNAGTVTSIGISVPTFLSAGSAITTNGTIAISLSGTALPVANGGTGLTSPGTTGNLLTSNGTAWVSSPAPISLPTQTGSNGKFLTTDGSTATWSTLPLVDTTHTVTGISGTAATISVDFSSVSSSTIIIPLPSGTTSATITFTNLASKATSGTVFSFSVILSNVTALTATTSVAWRHGAAVLPKWTGNIVPPSTVTAAAIDIWTFFTYDAGTSLVGSLSMADVRNA